MTFRIPVYLVGAAGTPDADNLLCSPCIKCMVSKDGNPPWSLELLAMLDSGASVNAIDLELATKLGLSVAGSDELHTVSDAGQTTIYSAIMWIEGLNPMSLACYASLHRKTGHPYDLVLGRGFLTMFDFGFSKARNAWHLSLPASAE